MSCQLACQHCGVRCRNINTFKQHVRGTNHQQEVAKLFLTDEHKGPVYFAIMTVLEPLNQKINTNPITGLDLVTMCITPEKLGVFYLCHVCEERLNSSDAVKHLTSADHYFNYLAYGNVERLCFGWLRMDSMSLLKPVVQQEATDHGCGVLRAFQLPKEVFKAVRKQSYNKVMKMFSKTDGLIECLRADRPLRKTIQNYAEDPTRMHPLVGLDFLVQYSCLQREWHCGYLCMLCQKKLPANHCISHFISFHHIFWYLQAAHPGTLEEKSNYTYYSPRFSTEILSLAKQAEKLHRPGQAQEVPLEPSFFDDVDSSSYSNALDKLQQVRREKQQSALGASVTPGDKLVCIAEDSAACPAAAMVNTCEKEGLKSSVSQPSLCMIMCLDCNKCFRFITDYKKHVRGTQHRWKLDELFGPGQYAAPVAKIALYQDLTSSSTKHPVIGLQLLTVILTRQWSSPPLYLCHACRLKIASSSASSHFTSLHHYLNVVKYSHPEDIPFGWLRSLGGEHVKNLAVEQKEGETRVLQVCDVSGALYGQLNPLSYGKALKRILKHPALRDVVEVEKRITLQAFSKSTSRKSPLLGLQFMVEYSEENAVWKRGFLCLLCEKKLCTIDAVSHMLSFDHISSFLNLAHPGSLGRNSEYKVYDDDFRSLVLDLAKQARKIHSEGSLQEVSLKSRDFHAVNSADFCKALSTLRLVYNQRRLGDPVPCVTPGNRLVPTAKESHHSATSQKPGSTTPLPTANPTTQPTTIKPPQPRNPTPPPESPKPASAPQAPNPAPPVQPTKPTTSNQPSVPSSHVNRTELTSLAESSDPTLEMRPAQPTQSQIPSHASQLQMPNPKPNAVKTSAQTSISAGKCTHPQETTVTTLQPRSPPGSPTQPHNKEAAPVSPLVDAKAVTGRPEESRTVPPGQTSLSSTELWDFLKRKNREPVIGLSDVIECHTEGKPPLYVCITCAKQIPQNFVITHLTSSAHRLKHLKSIQYAPLLAKTKVKKRFLQAMAYKLEKDEGYGTAQTLEFEPEEFEKIASAPIVAALMKLRDCLLQTPSQTHNQSQQTNFPRDIEYETNTQPHMLKKLKTDTKDRQDVCNTSKSEEPVVDMSTIQSPVSADSVQAVSVTSTELSATGVSTTLTGSSELPVKKHGVDKQKKQLKLRMKDRVGKIKPVVGLNFLTCVHHGLRKLLFCELCCVRSTVKHMVSTAHRKQYVELKYPCWTAGDMYVKRKLRKMALCLERVEKDAGLKMKKCEVTASVFLKLRTAPLSEALSTLKTLQTMDGDSQKQSPSAPRLNPSPDPSTLSCPSDASPDPSTLSCPSNVLDSGDPEQKNVPCSHNSASTTPPSGPHTIPCVSSTRPSTLPLKSPSPPPATSTTPLSLPPRPYSPVSPPLLPPHSDSSPSPETPPPDLYPLSISSLQFIPSDLSHSVPEPNHVSSLLPYHVPPESADSSLLLSLTKLPLPYSPVFTPPPPLDRISPPPPPPQDHSSPPTPPQDHSSPHHDHSSPPEDHSSPPSPPHDRISPPPPPYNHSSPPLPPHDRISILRSLHSHISPSVSWEKGQTTNSDSSDIRQAGPVLSCTSPKNTGLHRPHTPRQILRLSSPPSWVKHSHVSLFLKTLNLFHKEPIIGLGNIIECRAVNRPTIFLCLACSEKISRTRVCDHMISLQHQEHCIHNLYGDVLRECQQWSNQMLTKAGFAELAWKLARMEEGLLDAQVVTLDDWQYDLIQSTDFQNAIEFLKKICAEPNQSSWRPCSPGKWPEICHSTGPQDSAETTPVTPRALPPPNYTPEQQTESQRSSLLESGQNTQGTDKEPEVSQRTLKTQPQPKNLVQGQPESSHSPQIADTWHSEQNQGQPGPRANSVSDTGAGNTRDTTQEPLVGFAQEKSGNTKPAGTENPSKPVTNLRENVNKRRTDAVVGLSAIIACCCVDQNPFYLCVSCSSKLSHDLIMDHLLKSGHRESYLCRRYPHFFEGWSDLCKAERTKRSYILMQIASDVEKSQDDEPGQPQEVLLDSEDFREIKAMSFDTALTRLQEIRRQQNLQELLTSVSPKPRRVRVKQEKLDVTEITQNCSSRVKPPLTSEVAHRASKRSAPEPLDLMASSHGQVHKVKSTTVTPPGTEIFVRESVAQPRHKRVRFADDVVTARASNSDTKDCPIQNGQKVRSTNSTRDHSKSTKIQSRCLTLREESPLLKKVCMSNKNDTNPQQHHDLIPNFPMGSRCLSQLKRSKSHPPHTEAMNTSDSLSTVSEYPSSTTKLSRKTLSQTRSVSESNISKSTTHKVSLDPQLATLRPIGFPSAKHSLNHLLCDRKVSEVAPDKTTPPHKVSSPNASTQHLTHPKTCSTKASTPPTHTPNPIKSCTQKSLKDSHTKETKNSRTSGLRTPSLKLTSPCTSTMKPADAPAPSDKSVRSHTSNQSRLKIISDSSTSKKIARAEKQKLTRKTDMLARPDRQPGCDGCSELFGSKTSRAQLSSHSSFNRSGQKSASKDPVNQLYENGSINFQTCLPSEQSKLKDLDLSTSMESSRHSHGPKPVPKTNPHSDDLQKSSNNLTLSSKRASSCPQSSPPSTEPPVKRNRHLESDAHSQTDPLISSSSTSLTEKPPPPCSPPRPSRPPGTSSPTSSPSQARLAENPHFSPGSQKSSTLAQQTATRSQSTLVSSSNGPALSRDLSVNSSPCSEVGRGQQINRLPERRPSVDERSLIDLWSYEGREFTLAPDSLCSPVTMDVRQCSSQKLFPDQDWRMVATCTLAPSAAVMASDLNNTQTVTHSPCDDSSYFQSATSNSGGSVADHAVLSQHTTNAEGYAHAMASTAAIAMPQHATAGLRYSAVISGYDVDGSVGSIVSPGYTQASPAPPAVLPGYGLVSPVYVVNSSAPSVNREAAVSPGGGSYVHEGASYQAYQTVQSCQTYQIYPSYQNYPSQPACQTVPSPGIQQTTDDPYSLTDKWQMLHQPWMTQSEPHPGYFMTIYGQKY